MAKKKHAEEHENLERWLVSYADFMTLLFATFVVLYALAQSDVNAFKNIEEALRRAFNQNLLSGQPAMLSGTDSILDGGAINNPLMLEYMSQKYEQTSYDEIKENIDKLNKRGLEAEIDERGLVIRLNSDAIQYEPGTAELKKECLEILDVVAKVIKEKFAIHFIQVEGHTDPDPISNKIYPSNWELSSARASSVIRYFIRKHNFNPKLFIATGLADTIPIVSNSTAENKAKNRRVEIIILKNKNKHLSKKNMQQILEEARAAQKKARERLSKQALENLTGGDKELLRNVVDLTDTYENESKRLQTLDNYDYMHDGQKPDFME